MIQPNELKLGLFVNIGDGHFASSDEVWEVLKASYDGNLQILEEIAERCHPLLYAQYNYTPPIHFAVREGHSDLVKFLLKNGAHAPEYKTYPFLDSLQTLADDRGLVEIKSMLDSYASNPSQQRYTGDNGEIIYHRLPLQKEFEDAVDKNDLNKTREILKHYPPIVLDETYFWGEGILTMPAKEFHREMIDLLLQHGATIPSILKWTQFYYFERYNAAAYMLEKGMNPNTMNWHHVTILHDMAQKGYIEKAELLLKHGANINAIDEEYKSTPLGMAVRWGQTEMVKFLLSKGADAELSGAKWSHPLTWAIKKGYSEIEEILRQRA